MAHWAELDENNKVVRVVVTDNNEEDEGYSWLINNLGGKWVQTSYNGNFRKNFASIDYIYLPEQDIFIPPQPFASWKLSNVNFEWKPPKPQPNDGWVYLWNESKLDWENQGFKIDEQRTI